MIMDLINLAYKIYWDIITIYVKKVFEVFEVFLQILQKILAFQKSYLPNTVQSSYKMFISSNLKFADINFIYILYLYNITHNGNKL